MGIRTVLTCVVLVLAGCGPEAGDASSECETLISTFCERVDECSLNINEDECRTSARETINCGDAAEVDDSYDRCLDEIRTSSCDGLLGAAVALPASCKGAIKLLE